MSIAFATKDPATSKWVAEVMEPWFTSSPRTAEWQVRLRSSRDAYAEVCDRRPRQTTRRACFTRDREILHLDGWTMADGVTVVDTKRSCFILARPFEIDMVSDPVTRQWRFALLWVLREIAVTRLRQTELDLHAAALEAGNRAILISGPKRAGKTTLSIHLMRSGCRLIGNDRVFAGGAGSSFGVHGIPTAVTIRTETVAQFPELAHGLPLVQRLYLYTADELRGALDPNDSPPSTELALSPTQLARQLHGELVGSAPLGAIVFPTICPDVDGWRVERLRADEVQAGIWANLYGDQSHTRPRTLFEELSGVATEPNGSLAASLAHAVPGFRVVLGPNAYAERDSGRRMAERLLAES